MAIERIQLRRGTAQQWTETDPVLGAAEIGVELGTPSRFKIGDGSSLWSELPYFGSSEESSFIPIAQKGVANGVATLDANGAIPTGQLANIINSAPETLDTLNELAAALADDANFATTILTELEGKASTSHTHTISDVQSLGSEITSLQSSISNLEFVNFNQQNQIDELLAAPSPSASMIYSTATTYGLLASNAGNIISISNASSIGFIVNDVFAPGEEVTIYKKGDGIITFTAGSGVTLEGAGASGVSLKLTNKFGAVNIFCERAGVYAIIGDVEIA